MLSMWGLINLRGKKEQYADKTQGRVEIMNSKNEADSRDSPIFC